MAHWIKTDAPTSCLTVSPRSHLPMTEEISRMYPKGYFGGLKELQKIKLPPLSEIRKYWRGRLEPEPEEEPCEAIEIKRTRKQWIFAIHSHDVPQVILRGAQDSWLIPTLIHDSEYRQMYIRYLIMKREEPTPLLLEELRRLGHRSVADEIMECVIIDSTDL